VAEVVATCRSAVPGAIRGETLLLQVDVRCGRW